MQGKPIQCKAAVAWAPKQPLDVTTVTVAPPGPGEVRVRIAGVCVCVCVLVSTSARMCVHASACVHA